MEELAGKVMCEQPYNNRFQPTYLPPLRHGKSAAEPERWAPHA
jgi:hypothetical protein